jgi:hypothetical protein
MASKYICIGSIICSALACGLYLEIFLCFNKPAVTLVATSACVWRVYISVRGDGNI